MTFLFEEKKKKKKTIKIHLAKYSSVPTVLFELQTVTILTKHVSVE